MGLILPVQDGWGNFGVGPSRYHLEQVAPLAARKGITGLTEQVDLGAEPVVAFVNHNRWLAECPDCTAAVHIWMDRPVMLCLECWNASIGGRYRRVVTPSNRAEIEKALSMRPLPQTRNWRPPETVDYLWAENQQHGLGGV